MVSQWVGEQRGSQQMLSAGVHECSELAVQQATLHGAFLAMVHTGDRVWAYDGPTPGFLAPASGAGSEVHPRESVQNALPHRSAAGAR